jgi:shikimate kinase
VEEERKAPAASPITNVIMVGLTGSGKTTVGWQLSRQLNLGFIDLDRWIEASEKRSVQQIFSQNGEEYFRAAESKALEDLQSVRHHVIALGSGAVLREENWVFLKKIGIVIWLDSSVREIARRMLCDVDQLAVRPLLDEVLKIDDPNQKLKNLQGKLSALYDQRKSFYQRADYTISEDFSSPEHCAYRLRSLIEKRLNPRAKSNS